MRKPPRLKPLLVALSLSVLSLPIAFTILLAAFMRSGLEEGPIYRFASATRELRKAVYVDSSGLIAARASYRSPVWLELLVADSGGRVIVSTFPDLRPGGRITREALADISGRRALGRCYYADEVEIGGFVLGTWYALVPARDFRSEFESWRPLVNVALFSILALMACLAGLAVAARLGSAVLKLERAAGRMASGDLETAIQVKGVQEIVDLARAMDGMRAALRDDLARRSRFLAAISHDLRTPLTSISGYLEAIEDGLAGDPGTLARYVAIMRDKSRLLEGRIAGLIEFAKMETGEWRMSFESIELAVFLGQLAGELREDAALLGRNLDVRLDAVAGIRVQADRVLLRRAFENLFSNALRHAPEGSTVRFAARRKSGGLEISVEDEGRGLDPGEAEKVFEPFYRGSGAREGEGLGLGLHIARSIIQGHGWLLKAETGSARQGPRVPEKPPPGSAGDGAGAATGSPVMAGYPVTTGYAPATGGGKGGGRFVIVVPRSAP